MWHSMCMSQTHTKGTIDNIPSKFTLARIIDKKKLKKWGSWCESLRYSQKTLCLQLTKSFRVDR